MGRSVAIPLILALASCATPPKPTPPAPVVVPVPEEPATAVDWRDLPVSPGRWAYVPSATTPIAQYARPAELPDFTIKCDRKARTLILFRSGGTSGPMAITTSYSGLEFAVQTASDGVSVTLPATSDFLDRIAFSRGHVSIAVPGRPLLVLPAWAEPARVIQDCRA